MTIIAAFTLHALAWLSFGIGHSVLATAQAKHLLLTALGPYYRLAYNLFALCHIAAVWFVGAWIFADIPSYIPPIAIQWTQNGLAFTGIVIVALALREYDLGHFAGTAQIRNHWAGRKSGETEPLQTAGFHAYVRHPLYTGAYLLLWGNAQNELGLSTAVWGSLYLAIGTLFEEKQLVATYGDAYRRYRDRVPAVLPWRGRAI